MPAGKRQRNGAKQKKKSRIEKNSSNPSTPPTHLIFSIGEMLNIPI
jgi:hypothetical protein